VIKIDKYNYEAFFLDYWENRLDDAQREQLRQFLEENPRLRDEFNAFQGIAFEPDPVVHYPDKSKLKSAIIEVAGVINAENYRDYMAASYEGDLDRALEENLEEFLRKNPFLRDEQRLYKLARVSPDTHILYPHKESLYQKPTLSFNLPRLYRIAAAAAVLAILFGVYQFFLRPGMPPAGHDERNSPSLAMKPLTASLKTTHFRPELAGQSRNIPDPILRLSERKTEPLLPMPALAMQTPLATEDAGLELLAFQRPSPAMRLNGEEQTLAGRIISGLFRNISDRVEPTMASTEELRNKKMTFWDLAESGINGYNYLTNNDVVLVRTLDEEGRTRKVRLMNSEH
jgi:hypothetical protein